MQKSKLPKLWFLFLTLSMIVLAQQSMYVKKHVPLKFNIHTKEIYILYTSNDHAIRTKALLEAINLCGGKKILV